MRSSISIALTLGLFLLLGPAPQADADTTTAVHMVLLEGSTGNLVCSGAPGGPGGTGFVDGDCSANPGDHLKFAITMNVDSAGVGAWSLDLAWDQQLQNALELLVKVEPVTDFYRGFVDPGPPQVTIGYTFAPPGGTILQQDSSPTQEGRIEQITSGTPNVLTDTISETSFRAANGHVCSGRNDGDGSATRILPHRRRRPWETRRIRSSSLPSLARLPSTLLSPAELCSHSRACPPWQSWHTDGAAQTDRPPLMAHKKASDSS